MHKLLDQYLCNKYPKILANRNNQKSCMKYGISCGNGWFYILDRLFLNIQHYIDNPNYVLKKDIKSRLKRLWNLTIWDWIIDPLLNNLSDEDYIKSNKLFHFQDLYVPSEKSSIPQVIIEQIKEKLSGLRIYYSGGNDYIRGLVDMAQQMSYSVCEDCGQMNNTVSRNSTGWIRTLCESCRTSGKEKEFLKNHNKDLQKIWKKINE